jgi:hypothetical protein
LLLANWQEISEGITGKVTRPKNRNEFVVIRAATTGTDSIDYRCFCDYSTGTTGSFEKISTIGNFLDVKYATCGVNKPRNCLLYNYRGGIFKKISYRGAVGYFKNIAIALPVFSKVQSRSPSCDFAARRTNLISQVLPTL